MRKSGTTRRVSRIGTSPGALDRGRGTGRFKLTMDAVGIGVENRRTGISRSSSPPRLNGRLGIRRARSKAPRGLSTILLSSWIIITSESVFVSIGCKVEFVIDSVELSRQLCGRGLVRVLEDLFDVGPNHHLGRTDEPPRPSPTDVHAHGRPEMARLFQDEHFSV